MLKIIEEQASKGPAFFINERRCGYLLIEV